jgi:hypothetical protein
MPGGTASRHGRTRNSGLTGNGTLGGGCGRFSRRRDEEERQYRQGRRNVLTILVAESGQQLLTTSENPNNVHGKPVSVLTAIGGRLRARETLLS